MCAAKQQRSVLATVKPTFPIEVGPSGALAVEDGRPGGAR